MVPYHTAGHPSPLLTNGTSVSPKYGFIHQPPTHSGVLIMRHTTMPTAIFRWHRLSAPCLPSRGPAAILAPDEFANEDSCFESLPIGRSTLVALFIPATTAAWCAAGAGVPAGGWAVGVGSVLLGGSAVSIITICPYFLSTVFIYL